MATDQRSVQQNTFANVAAWRTAIQAIQASLIAAGAVLTSDTGQIDSSTTPSVTPASTNTSIGYNIYRFSDTLQATKPVYIRLDYATGAVATAFVLRVQVGTGTDGAGTLTGQTAAQTILSAGAGATPSATFYASCGTDYIAFAWGFSLTSFFTFVVGRMKDDTGADTGEGVIILTGWTSSNTFIQALPFSGAVPSSVSAILQLGGIGTISGTAASVSDVALGPVPVPVAGKWRYLVGALLYAPSSIGSSVATAFSAVAFGRSRTFMGLGSTVFASRWGVDSATSLAIPWE